MQFLIKCKAIWQSICTILSQKWLKSSSSSSIGTTAHCALWPVEKCSSIFSYLPPLLSIFSLPALEDLLLLLISILSWVFPFFSSLPVLERRSFWASYPPSFSLGDLTSLSLTQYSSDFNILHFTFPSYKIRLLKFLITFSFTSLKTIGYITCVFSSLVCCLDQTLYIT